jgi:hypothetical protein
MLGAPRYAFLLLGHSRSPVSEGGRLIAGSDSKEKPRRTDPQRLLPVNVCNQTFRKLEALVLAS